MSLVTTLSRAMPSVAFSLVMLSLVLYRRMHIRVQNFESTGASTSDNSCSERYARQTRVWGAEEQEHIRKSSILVVGMGGLGSTIVPLLAGAGVGRLGLIDFDRVSVTNLHRQTMFDTSDAERDEYKVDAAARFVRNLNPLDISVEIHRGSISCLDDALFWAGKFNIVVDATDSISTRLLLNRACVILRKPLVCGVVQDLAGYVAVFWPGVKPEAGCFACAFPHSLKNEASPPIAGVAPAVIGALQASEALKLARNASSSSASGYLLAIDLSGPMDRNTFTSIKLRPRSKFLTNTDEVNQPCPACGALCNYPKAPRIS